MPPSPPSPPPPPPASLSILLYNVWNLPSCLTDGNSRARAAKIGQYLTEYDVIVLNEAFVNKPVLLAALDAAGSHPHRKRLGRQFYTPLDSGIVVLSRYPIVASAAQHFRRRAGVDILAAKGIVFVRLQLSPTRQLDLYGTHAQAGAAPSHQRARAAQAAQISNFIDAHSPLLERTEARPVVLTGDLNMGPVLDTSYNRYSSHYVSPDDARARHAAYTTLRIGSALRDVFPADGRNKEDIIRFLVGGPLNAFAASPNVSYPKWATRELSDTPALLCRLTYAAADAADIDAAI